MAVLAAPLSSDLILVSRLKSIDGSNTSVMRLSTATQSDLQMLAYIMDSSNNQLTRINLEIVLDPLIDYTILRPEDSVRTGS